MTAERTCTRAAKATNAGATVCLSPEYVVSTTGVRCTISRSLVILNALGGQHAVWKSPPPGSRGPVVHSFDLPHENGPAKIVPRDALGNNAQPHRTLESAPSMRTLGYPCAGQALQPVPEPNSVRGRPRNAVQGG